MRKRFDQDIRDIKDELMAMAAVVDEALQLAIDAMIEGKAEAAATAANKENEIFEYERIIERRCMLLILYQQPVATDLRNLTAMLRMNKDLMRIGSQTVELSRLVQSNVKKVSFKGIDKLLEMAQAVRQMTYDAAHSYAILGEELARDVIQRDDTIDELFLEFKKGIVKGLKKDVYKAGVAIDTLLIGKYLEKIADHAASFAAYDLYVITGEPVENFFVNKAPLELTEEPESAE